MKDIELGHTSQSEVSQRSKSVLSSSHGAKHKREKSDFVIKDRGKEIKDVEAKIVNLTGDDVDRQKASLKERLRITSTSTRGLIQSFKKGKRTSLIYEVKKTESKFIKF